MNSLQKIYEQLITESMLIQIVLHKMFLKNETLL